jgi:hypothetical protein
LQRLEKKFNIEKNIKALSKQGDYYAPDKKTIMVAFDFFSFVYRDRFSFLAAPFKNDPGKKAFRESPPPGYHPENKN